MPASNVRVKGHLDRCWSDWLDGLSVSHHAEGTTVLAGIMADQAALHGVLAKIRGLGLTLISVTPTEPK